MSAVTLVAAASHSSEIKRSRFIAHAAPVATPQVALDYLAEISDPNATHNCWAYRIGAQYRFSDDGEPAGTAGRPILSAIDGQGFDHVIAVVTRWYGGTNLGAGGLVRAYGGSVAECLRLASRQSIIAWHRLTLACQFSDIGTLHAVIAQHDAEKLDETFNAEGVQLRLRVPVQQLDALKSQLRDATRNSVRIEDDRPHD